MNLRPRLSYANVAATIALVTAIGLGTAFAAGGLGKNDVRSRNIAPGAVKRADLGKSAVTSPKTKDRTIWAGDFAAGVIQNDLADVTGSASGGPKAGLNTNTSSPLPLSGTTTFTPHAGGVSALVLEAQFTLDSASGMTCSPGVGVLANGNFTRAFAETAGTTSTTPVTQFGRGADAPFVLIDPGSPIDITASVFGDSRCSPDTQLDRLEIRIVEIR